MLWGRRADELGPVSVIDPAIRTDERIKIIGTLRGAASIAVIWFHLTHETGLVPTSSWLDVSGTYGWYCAEVFFVISGFVIPYSLLQSRYRVSQFGRFVLRRVVRLDPPYLAAIAASLLIALWYSVGRGEPFRYSPVQVVVHLGYVNAFFGYRWIDPVYWLLAVEVQFYVLAGLAFPLIVRRNLFWLVAAPLCIVASFVVRGHDYVCQYLPFFMLGIAALHHRRKMIDLPAFVGLILVLAICARFRMGGGPATAGFAAALMIGTVDREVRFLSALGTISYSLFLVHLPVLQLIKIFMPTPMSLAAHLEIAALNVVGGLVAAWIWYRWIELPSHRLSHKIRYEIDD